MASRARGGRSRRGGRRRARALGRPRAAPRRRRRGGRVPRASGRADPRPGTARGARARRRAGQAARPGAARPREALLATAELEPAGRASARAAAAAARADRVRLQRAAATLRRCCSTPPRRLEALDPALARETYLEALGAAMFAGRLDADSGVLRGRRGGPRRARRRRSRRDRSTSCSTAWRAGARRAPRRACRRSGSRCEAVSDEALDGHGGDHALAVAVAGRPVDDGVRALGRRRVPRARHPRGASWPGTPARSPCFPSRSSTGRACTCSPGSSPRPRR